MRTVLGIAALLLAPSAQAHGIWGHVHVTGWAVENMPDDELKAFLSEPEVFNSLLFGAAFTDSGYAPPGDDAARAYSEHTHWEPFIEDFVQWIQVNDPPPWDDLASRKRVAFLMGCASHGLQDSVFDTLFLEQVAEQDNAGQDETDPGTDGFLVLDEHVRFVPETDIPMDTLLELYEVLNHDVDEDTIIGAVNLMTGFYVNDDAGLKIAAKLGEDHEDVIPWTRVHYLDPEVPGSLRSEIFPTMHYQQALWARLHQEFEPDDVVIHAFPEEPRRLRSGDPATVNSWTTLLFGAGVAYDPGMLALEGPNGPVAFSPGNTRWGADFTRVVRLMPDEPLNPGEWYTASLAKDTALIDGTSTSKKWKHTFQVECDKATEDECEDIDGDIVVADIDGPEPEPDPEPEAKDEVEPRDQDGGDCGCRTSTSGVGWLDVFRRR